MESNKILQTEFQDVIKRKLLPDHPSKGKIQKDDLAKLAGNFYCKGNEVTILEVAKNADDLTTIAERRKNNLQSSLLKNDTKIANEILNTWRWDWNWNIHRFKLKVKVQNGWVTLEGEVEWNYEKEAAKQAAEKIKGVTGVHNNITLKSSAKDAVKVVYIARALHRSWILNDKDVTVDVDCNNVKLTGFVNSLYQKEEAERLAWNTPGVWSVENNLNVLFF